MKYLLFALLCLIWGSTWLVIKVGYGGLGPFNIAAVRFLVAGLVLAPLVPRWPRTRPEWSLIVCVGVVLFAADYGLIYWAEQWLDSGLTAMIFAVLPVMTSLAAHVYLKTERLTTRTFVATAAAFAGVVALFADRIAVDRAQTWPMAAILAAAAFATIAALVTKRYGAAIHPAALNAPAMLVGAAVLALVGVATGETLRLPGDRATWFAVMYLAIAGSAVTFLIYFWLLKTWSATTLSFIAVVTPLVAVVLGFLVRGERATAGMAVGGALIVGSVVLAMWTTMPLPARSPLQMSGKSIAWILGAVVAFVLAVSGVLFGVNLLPNGATAQEKGTFIPWLVTWAMIALTTVSGVVLAGFLVVTGLNEGRR